MAKPLPLRLAQQLHKSTRPYKNTHACSPIVLKCSSTHNISEREFPVKAILPAQSSTHAKLENATRSRRRKGPQTNCASFTMPTNAYRIALRQIQ